MSEPRALPDEERPFVPDEEIWEGEESLEHSAQTTDEGTPEEDEPDAFAGDEEPFDVRTEES